MTATLPPTTGQDMQGVNRRLAIFLDAVSGLGRAARILRIVPPGVADEWRGREDRLGEIESAFWSCDVQVRLAPRAQRTETFASHYLRGIAGIAGQPDFHLFCGAEAARTAAEELDRRPGLVFAHRLGAMLTLLRAGPRQAPVFFDLDDVEHRVRLRHAVVTPLWPGKLLYALHAPAVLLAERRGARASRATFVCSERDRALLTRLGFPGVAVVPNAVQAPPSAAPLTPEPTILFLGAMSYEPNREGAERLARQVMPLLWRDAPEARLLVAGKYSEELRRDPEDPRIEHLGFVDDLDALYARARIVCCPLRNGGGTRVKLIEAAAHGKAMVATALGAEGLAFRDGEEIVIRDDDAGLAHACARLLADDAACTRLGAAARIRMQASYERSAIARDVRAIFEQAA